MEFWEGAVLVVGGLWLIGKVARQAPNQLVSHVMPTSLNTSLLGGAGNTVGTNHAGDSSLVSGETLQDAPPLPPQSRGVMVISTQTPSRPTSPVVPMRTPFTPAPMYPVRAGGLPAGRTSGGVMTENLRARMIEL